MPIYKDMTDNLRETATIRETISGLVSIVIPVWGEIVPNNILSILESFKNQKEINVEIIVSEYNLEPLCSNYLDESVKYVFNQITTEDLNSIKRGEIRNHGALLATGEFLFTCDCDIIMLNEYFLKDSVKFLNENPWSCIHRPVVSRLPKEDVQTFHKKVQTEGFRKTVDSIQLTNDEIVATFDGIERDLIIPPELGWTTIFRDDYEKYMAEEATIDRLHEVTCGRDHQGSMMVRAEQFDIVGGYSDRYQAWGWEDIDIQWKLARLFNLRYYFNYHPFKVMHLDHDRSVNTELLHSNIKCYNNRKNKGIYHSVIEDQAKLKLLKEY